jgi:hypothetical protein
MKSRTLIENLSCHYCGSSILFGIAAGCHGVTGFLKTIKSRKLPTGEFSISDPYEKNTGHSGFHTIRHLHRSTFPLYPYSSRRHVIEDGNYCAEPFRRDLQNVCRLFRLTYGRHQISFRKGKIRRRRGAGSINRTWLHHECGDEWTRVSKSATAV